MKSFQRKQLTFSQGISFFLTFFQTLWVVSWYYFLYQCQYQTKETCMILAITELSKLNIIYTKVLQWIINDTIYSNQSLLEVFEQFTNQVHYEKEEVNYELLYQVLQEKKITLLQSSPINAGTLSLVYEGKRENGNHIVLKILKKNIRGRLQSSIEYFDIFCYFLEWFPSMSHYNLSKIIHNNFDNLMKQTDFSHEIENMELFYETYQSHSSIIIPSCDKEITNQYQDIIVMDYLEGKSIYYVEPHEYGVFSKLFANFIFDCILEQHFFHGDLHPGNVLFYYDTMTNHYSIRLIDFGIICQVDSIIKTKVHIFLKYVFTKNYDELFHYLIFNLVESFDKEKEKENDYDTHVTKDMNETENEETKKTKYEEEHAKKTVIVNELIQIQKEMNLLDDYLKDDDLFYINQTLRKHNLMLTNQFNELLIFLCSMYSILFVFKKKETNDDFDIFRKQFLLQLKEKESKREKNNLLLLQRLKTKGNVQQLFQQTTYFKQNT